MHGFVESYNTSIKIVNYQSEEQCLIFRKNTMLVYFIQLIIISGYENLFDHNGYIMLR